MPEEIKKDSRGGARPGAGRPKGIPQREAQKNASRVHLIKKRLVDHSLGKCDMSGSQVRAAEVVLDRHEPRLASIEQTYTDPRDTADPAQLAQRLAAMFAEKPQLWDQIVALRAAQQVQQNSTEQHVTH